MRSAALLMLAVTACEQPREARTDTVAAQAEELTAEADAAVDRQIEEMGPVELWTPAQDAPS